MRKRLRDLIYGFGRGVLKFIRWFNRNAVVIVPSIILILLVPILIGVALTLAHVSTQQDQINSVQTSQREGTIATCERGNETRLINLGNYGADRRKARKELTKEIAVERRYPLAARASFIHQLHSYIHEKTKTIRRTIEAQATVAIKPGSPIVDCPKAAEAASSHG